MERVCVRCGDDNALSGLWNGKAGFMCDPCNEEIAQALDELYTGYEWPVDLTDEWRDIDGVL